MQFRPRPTTIVLLTTLALAAPSAAHRERPIESPPRAGSVPELTRKSKRTLVVCKAASRPSKLEVTALRARVRAAAGTERDRAAAALTAAKANLKLFKKCRYEHIQAAVNDATDGTTIKVMPGVYREEPSRAVPSNVQPPDLPDGSYSYEHHLTHPHDANLIAILGKKNLTLEGTGADPRDVLIDAGFVKDVPIRADRADGIIIRNLWARDGKEHCIYVVETSGYVFDRTVGSYCRDYELFSYASDHGLYTDCEAEGGGDSGIYTGGNPDTSGENRFAVEIRRCRMHTNALGFSGTQGNSVWMHDNDVYDNAVGLSFNTQNDHPNPPERQSLIENNLIHDNNLDIYAADAPTPAGGPAYGFLRYPVGSGIWIVGGDDNVIRNNFIYGNQRFGVMLFGNPLEGPILAEVNRNQVYGNVIGVDPDGNVRPNGSAEPPGTTPFVEGATDLFWGGSGNDNCWGAQDARSGAITYGPPAIAAFQPCPFPNVGEGFAVPRIEVAELLLSCVLEPDSSNPGRYVTADDFYPCPWGRENFSSYQNRNERECGNETVDVGEECDAGYSGGPTGGESCDSLGLGPGDLACNSHCDFDRSDCASSACGAFADGAMRFFGNSPSSSGFVVSLAKMDVAGRSFDPVAEGLDITIRGGGAVHTVRLPAHDDRWKTFRSGWKFDTGLGGHEPLKFRRAGTLIAPVLGGGSGSVRSVIVRVGDDCWHGELSCYDQGRRYVCTKRRRL